MRIGLISFGVREFAALRETCVAAGHDPVVYAYSRSMRPRSATDEGAGEVVGRITAELPAGVDLLVPGSSEGLGAALRGYGLDLVVCYGFSWRLPRSVLRIPRHGMVNVHCSMLPKYRGPAPVLWAIRNGDPDLGVTAHRMNEEFDAGPVLAQEDGVPIPDDVTPESLWDELSVVLRRVVAAALERVTDPSAGEPQPKEGVSHAGLMESAFFVVDTSKTAREVHNQVRTFRYMGPGLGPAVTVAGRRLKVLGTSLAPADGPRLDCADGPVWITASEPAE
ncbi:methionyl-tRNA formyltransferase [Streptomyces radicis]|uniref:Methionyl-tRNA formyltransferase n=1 Tax=Streptomyces radicis TaxID=1750517 RepID=A0A3A9VXK2_9ACTN|nr:formyltransferase family protein [Streptomyces radicis]RKN04893.1 methionyl-tRNA formyltransferase [Streptomyces radicis]RKN25441.1 methionyl-tRNA formyltransferase [Streptomyces radicis]